MKIYGTEVKGPLIIDKESTLSAWTSADEGRLVYAEDVDKVYYGSNTAWNVWAKDVSDTAYAASWDGVTDVAPSKNAVYDELYARPRRNAIINGCMRVWQRGTTDIARNNSSVYLADRFRVYSKFSAPAAFSIMYEDITPTSGFPFKSALKIDCTATGTVEVGEIDYFVEGYDFIPFEGNAATLSFWVKATKTGIYCVSFRTGTQSHSYVVEYTVNSSNTWEKKTVAITFNSGGTTDYTTGRGLILSWTIFAGSSSHTTKDTWVSGSYIATSNQVNGFDSASNNFSLTGVQLELGSTATAFEYRPFAEELALCQRYYENGIINNLVGCYATDYWMVPYISFAVTKRVIPTIAFTRSSGVTGGTISANGETIWGFRSVIATGGASNTLLFVDGTFTATCEL